MNGPSSLARVLETSVPAVQIPDHTHRSTGRLGWVSRMWTLDKKLTTYTFFLSSSQLQACFHILVLLRGYQTNQEERKKIYISFPIYTYLGATLPFYYLLRQYNLVLNFSFRSWTKYFRFHLSSCLELFPHACHAHSSYKLMARSYETHGTYMPQQAIKRPGRPSRPPART